MDNPQETFNLNNSKQTRRAKQNAAITGDYAKITGFIYLYTSPSGKHYVGQTRTNVTDRWNQHVRESKNPNSHDQSRALNAAIRKYGENSFIIATLWTGEIGENNCIIDEMECNFIKEYNSMSPTGYNLREGGNGKMSATAIQQMVIGNVVKTENKKKFQEGEQLPKNVLYHREVNKNGTVLEGYKVSDHPKGSNKSFIKKTMTMEERKNAAIAYKEFLDNSPVYVDTTKKIPKGVCKYKDSGFSVTKPEGGRKFFGAKSAEENLKLALEYYESIQNK
jgi:GIY-YIG catalytic domain